MTRKEFQLKYKISDEMLKKIDWMMKEFKGQQIKVVDTNNGLPRKK